MEIIFSDIDEDDLVGCSELYVATFGDTPWNEEWSAEDAFQRLSDFLASPKSIAIKAIHNANICGFLFGELQQWNGGTFFYLKEICVNNAQQRRWIGKSLIGKLEETLTENRVSRIYLITQRDSVPSSFYSSLGFSENQNIMVMGKQVEKSS